VKPRLIQCLFTDLRAFCFLDGDDHGDSEICSRYSSLSRLQGAGGIVEDDESGLKCVSCRRVYPLRDEKFRDASRRSKDRRGIDDRAAGRERNDQQHWRSRSRLKRLIPRLRGKRIGVLGDLMLDRYLGGTASRLSPEAAVPVVDFVEQSECLGGAGNVAANIAALGARVEAFGVIGNDEPGRALQECFRALSIADKGIIGDAKRVTTVKTRIIARHQQVVRVDHERREPLRSDTQEKLCDYYLRRSRNLLRWCFPTTTKDSSLTISRTVF